MGEWGARGERSLPGCRLSSRPAHGKCTWYPERQHESDNREEAGRGRENLDVVGGGRRVAGEWHRYRSGEGGLMIGKDDR